MHEERDTTELDWLHKLSVKLKICEQFMTRIKQVKKMTFLRLSLITCLIFGRLFLR